MGGVLTQRAFTDQHGTVLLQLTNQVYNAHVSAWV